MRPGNRNGQMGNAVVTGDRKCLIEKGKKTGQKEK